MIEGEGYTKLFSSIVHSTVWREPDHVRLVWITMLALANRRGHVSASVPGLADAARVSVERCREALSILASPDPDSRTPDHEGRRIETVPGGWAILNHALYRERQSADHRRELARARVARHRARKKAAGNAPSNAMSRTVAVGHDKQRQKQRRRLPVEDAGSGSEVISGSGAVVPPAPIGADAREPNVHARMLAFYESEYRTRVGSGPSVSRADKSQLGRLLASGCPSDVDPARWPRLVAEALRRYLDDPGAPRPWLRESGWPLRTFVKRINAYLVPRDRRVSGGAPEAPCALCRQPIEGAGRAAPSGLEGEVHVACYDRHAAGAGGAR